MGCAGGEDAIIQFTYTEEEIPVGCVALKVSVTGMKGGHSGIDIPLGRGNANKVFFRILNAADRLGVRLASVDGGSLRNAIPREAFAVVVVEEAKAADFIALLDEVSSDVMEELSATEPGLTVDVEETDLPATVMDAKTQANLTASVVACPNGVIRMSNSMNGLVETSTNLAIVKSDAETKTIRVACLMRSSVDTAKKELGSRLKALFELAGAEVLFDGEYPQWMTSDFAYHTPTCSARAAPNVNNCYGDERRLRMPHSDEQLRRHFVLHLRRRVTADHTVPLGSVDYEVPRGHAGEQILVHRRLLDGTLAILHEGRLVEIHPVDLHANARARRGRPRDPREESPHPLPKSAADLAFERDFVPVVDPDGGFPEE